jgi:uncharacterized protein involved in exopolysaccharide biosynthesis
MTQRELAPSDYLAMLRRHWVLILILAVIGPPIGYGISRTLPNRYKSTTLVLVEQPSVPTDFVKPVDTTDINERLASMQQEILSRTRLEPLIHQYGLFPSDINKVPIDDLVARLQKAIEVTPVLPMAETRASNLPGFFVNVTLDDGRTAQEICTVGRHHSISVAAAHGGQGQSRRAGCQTRRVQEPLHGGPAGRRANQFESSQWANLAARCRQPGAGARAAG